jgi:RNA polymerase sigma factor (sigma-70 family)
VPEALDGAVDPSHESDQQLWGLVRGLPTKQRAAVVLRFVNDLPHEEIGQIIGCSEEAARRNLHEGLKKLKEVWKG